MKKEFTKQYIIDNQGCYHETKDKVNNLSFMKLETINIIDILNSEIPLKDKCWFLIKKCDFTIEQKKSIALLLAKSVVEIYNNKYPNDNRVNECIEAIELFNSGKITIDELREKRRYAAYAAADADAAYADAAAADAVAAAAAVVAVAYADAVAYSADAVADAVAYSAAVAVAVAYSADAVAYSADAVADAVAAAAAVAVAYAAAVAVAYADAVAAAAYKNKVLQVLIDFVNEN